MIGGKERINLELDKNFQFALILAWEELMKTNVPVARPPLRRNGTEPNWRPLQLMRWPSKGGNYVAKKR